MSQEFILKGNVLSFFRQSNLRVSGDLYKELDNEVRRVLDRAAKRAIANGRATVFSRDL